jgi:putative MATE family efflux protein
MEKNKSKGQRDLTKGSIMSNLIYMSMPASLAFLAQTLYSLVDMIWVGRLSTEAVAAITVFSTVYFLVFILNNIIGQGSVPTISQAYGAGDMGKTRNAISNTFSFKFIVGIISSFILLVILRPVLHLLTDDLVVIDLAVEYGRIMMIFLPLFFSLYTIKTSLRCCGDSKSPMIITFVSSIINVVLDPIFMFETIPVINLPGLGMGVYGVAVATVIANMVGLLMGGYILFGKNNFIGMKFSDIFTIDLKMARELITVGTPPAMANLTRNITNMILISLIGGYGTAALAAWGIISRIFNLLFIPLAGLMSGGSAMTGQNIGKNLLERAIETARTAGKLGIISMGILSGLTFILARPFFMVFINEAEVLALGVPALRIVAISLIPTGYYLGLATIFTGSGYTIPLLISAIIGQWAFQLPFVFLAVVVLNMPFQFVALSYFAFTLGEGAIILYFYKKGKWKDAVNNKMNEAVTA